MIKVEDYNNVMYINHVKDKEDLLRVIVDFIGDAPLHEKKILINIYEDSYNRIVKELANDANIFTNLKNSISNIEKYDISGYEIILNSYDTQF